MYIFRKETPKDAFTWFCLKMSLARQHLPSLNSETQLSPTTVTVFTAAQLTPEEMVWAVRGLAGPLHTDSTAPQTLYSQNAASSTNKKCWHSVHFSEVPQTKKEKLLSWLLTTSKPQAGNRKQMSSMECFAPGNFSSPCFYSKGTEGMEEQHKRTLFFFHLPQQKATCSKTRTLEVRQDREKKAGVFALTKNIMLPTSVSADYLRPSAGHQWPSLWLLCKENLWTQQTFVSTSSGPQPWLSTGDLTVPDLQEQIVCWETPVFKPRL